MSRALSSPAVAASLQNDSGQSHGPDRRSALASAFARPTTKEIGLDLPPTLLARADEVIE